MIGLHEELQQREASGRPVRVGLIGAGQMGTDVVATSSVMAGLRVVVTADIDLERARESYRIGQVTGEVVVAGSAAEADTAVEAGKLVAVKDFRIVTDMRSIDVMLESTGVPEIGALAALRSARTGQDLAMMNVETDITVGPILNWYARQKGVIYALAAGDEPAACKELYDLAVSMGFTVVAAGKGKNNPLDRHSTPADPAVQKEAARRGLSPNMLIEFVDGSKTMIEMAAVSNATGLVPDVRGMHGPDDGPRPPRGDLPPPRGRRRAEPDGRRGLRHRPGGAGCLPRRAHGPPAPARGHGPARHGQGPYYTLFRPFHLCSIEVPLTCALLAIRRRSNMAPLSRLVSEVFAVAKRDLEPGDTLDAIGGDDVLQPHRHVRGGAAEGLLPIGLAKGARLVRPVLMDPPHHLRRRRGRRLHAC